MIDHKQFEGHSEGLWFAQEVMRWSTKFHIVSNTGEFVAGVIVTLKGNTKANANLLAAAPLFLAENKALRELVEAQEAFIEWYRQNASTDYILTAEFKNLKVHQAAIAKAKAALG
jgi:hypothetical protein